MIVGRCASALCNTTALYGLRGSTDRRHVNMKRNPDFATSMFWVHRTLHISEIGVTKGVRSSGGGHSNGPVSLHSSHQM